MHREETSREPVAEKAAPERDDSTSAGVSVAPVAPRTFAWLRRFAKLWGFALFIVVIAYWFRNVLLPFVLAITLAYILAPVVNRMATWRIGRRTMPRGLAVILCYVVLLSGMGLFFATFLPRLSRDFARLGREAPKLWERANEDYIPRAARWIEARFPSLVEPEPERESPPAAEPGLATPISELPPPPGTLLTVTPLASGELAITVPESGLTIQKSREGYLVKPSDEIPTRRLEDKLRARMVALVKGLEGEIVDLFRFGQAIVTGLASFVMKLALVLMVAAFILIDLERIHRFVRGLIPGRYRHEYDDIVAGIDRGLNGVIRGQLLICLVNGVLTYVGLLLFDVKYSLLLGLIAAVMSLVPIFGSIVSSIPIVGIALVSGEHGIDLVRGLFVLGWIVGIHFVEANFLNPKIMGQAAKIHPVVVVFALIAGEHTYGLAGALLAVPVASMIQTLFFYFRHRAWKHDAALSSSPAHAVAVETSRSP